VMTGLWRCGSFETPLRGVALSAHADILSRVGSGEERKGAKDAKMQRKKLPADQRYGKIPIHIIFFR
jgi:hypothetical protein